MKIKLSMNSKVSNWTMGSLDNNSDIGEPKWTAKDLLKEYNENTTLHGPKYTTEDGNHFVEKYVKR